MTGSGQRIDLICLFLKMVMPIGFFISDAVLAKNLLGAMPIEQGKSISCKSRFCISVAIAKALVNPPIAVMSIYASSIETGSTKSVYVRRISKTVAEAVRYFSKSGATMTRVGQILLASPTDIVV